MPSKILILSTLIVASLRDVSAFLSQNNHFVGLRAPATTRSTKYQELHLFEEASDFASSVTANNLLLATIDSDIANIPDNEFATVFAGGIAVMAGGVISALIVGAILEKGNLYANVAAESYLQSADDEEFWKGLSDEEKKKTEELLSKIKAGKEGSTSIEASKSEEPAIAAAEPVMASESSSETKEDTTTKSQPSDMFSDY